MSKYKPGDEVIVVKGYPGDSGNSWYNKGDVLILDREMFGEYWIPAHKTKTSDGIFESCFRRLTKLDKALK